MPTGSSKDHDFMAVARRVVEQAIGENVDGSPLEVSTKNPEVVALGKLGGAARTTALTPEKRRESAKVAAKIHWHTKRPATI